VNDVVIARVVHVLAVVIWIGGVTMVTTVILPIVRTSGAISLLEAVERRFVWQARLLTLLVGASGFYMVARLSLWDRFHTIEFWWMHAMVLVCLIFSLILFVGEPLIVRPFQGRGRRTRHHDWPYLCDSLAAACARNNHNSRCGRRQPRHVACTVTLTIASIRNAGRQRCAGPAACLPNRCCVCPFLDIIPMRTRGSMPNA
jgi:uncharacterized membrane protein